MKILFFIGKGGVGKSTLSALCGLHLAKSGKRVLITSLDPAHNQSDIFETKKSAKTVKIFENLELLEIDQEKWIRNYLSETEKQITKSYAYLTAFGLEKHFSVLQYAPGIEEYALVRAFSVTLEKNKENDIYIFDMPPTALALRFFALSGISLLWLKKLFDLRREIEKKQEIISQIRVGSKDFERDRVMQNIQQQMDFWTKVDQLLKEKDKTIPLLVTNPDKLSMAEGERIKAKLMELKMPDPIIIINKTKDQKGNIKKIFSLPAFENLTGIDTLRAALPNINFKVLDDLLN